MTAPASLQTLLKTVHDRWGSQAMFVAAHATGTLPAGAMALAGPRAEHALLAPFAPYLQRGQIIEISGAASSGRTGLALALLAGLTAPGRLAAYVDSPHTFYPPSAAAAGVDLSRLWVVRLHDWQAALAATEKLCSGAIDVVLWDMIGQHETLTDSQIRRLQTATRTYGTTLLLLTTQPKRPRHRALDNGAAVRLVVHRQALLWECLGRQQLLAGYKLHVELARAPGKPYTRPVCLTLGREEHGACSSAAAAGSAE